MASDCRISFDMLPHDVLEKICFDPSLDYLDICHLAMASSCTRDVCCGSEIWKRKFCKRWPNLLRKYEPRGQHMWAELFRSRHLCCADVIRAVSTMSSLHYHDDEISDDAFLEFDNLVMKYSAEFVIDELHAIVVNGCTLTAKYYAVKISQYVVQRHLTAKWQSFLALPPGRQSVEQGAVLLSQWCQGSREVKGHEVKAKLDDLANMVRLEMEQRQLRHPAIGHCMESSEFTALMESLWSSRECRQVLETLNYVLFDKLGFRGNNDDYYIAENSYIDKVLDKMTGIPISLCVVYVSVSHRLGVLCHLVSFPQHFLVKWKEHPQLTGGQEFTYIDVYERGKFVSETELIMNGSSISMLETAPVVRVLRRMCHNLVNVARQQQHHGDFVSELRPPLELLTLLDASNDLMKVFLGRIYLHLNINLRQVPELLPSGDPEGEGLTAESRDSMSVAAELRESAREQLLKLSNQPPPQIVARRRSDNPKVLYSVGLIMKHKRYFYTCVIYGWDSKCEASNTWIYQMGVNHLTNKQHQPFYTVLVEDGSMRYAAQESLEIAKEPKVITNPKVGKYFEEFCTTHYRANDERMAEYPDDWLVTLEYVSHS
ncbi:hypothetical protein NP493_47g06058 [Ridgeia piscesae]|uniref:Hemimethylated DNA-binding domain-containing protein n=1 Tax=Ridgeia piscesae TaxID=27915 RepID=A0AAD9UJK4_RIDPI|nr:hypothetical protein NP493_47g06058 [Ridgeia piscesae]